MLKRKSGKENQIFVQIINRRLLEVRGGAHNPDQLRAIRRAATGDQMKRYVVITDTNYELGRFLFKINAMRKAKMWNDDRDYLIIFGLSQARIMKLGK